MEIVSAAAGEAAGSTIVHAERELGYLIHFRRSTNSLKDNIQQLTDTRRDVQAMIDAALGNGELVKEAVQGWMARADLVLVQASKLSEEASDVNSWFRGWCCGRFSLGRKAQKTIQVIQKIYEEGSRFGDNVSYPKPAQSLNIGGTEDFNAFGSRVSTAEDICKALLDDATNLVGVYGMAGVGKTALIKALANQVKEKQLFQEVVVVTVSQTPSLLKLQDDIAERLDLKDLGVDLSMRADRLCGRLDQDAKTTLVVLDDVWEKIELSKVGIRNGNCCKVVFTTRFEDVCDAMEANTKIPVSVLSEEDSWFLFQQKSGNVEDSSLARDLLKECKGLPLAIITLGLALRGKDAIVWADALVQLRKSIFEGMSTVVCSIKLSYNFLLSKSVKICFLYCCLFPEDHKIKLDVLLRYMMGEKLLENVETLDEARGRLHSIVVKLVSSGLLLRDEQGEIMMHDVVRDVAISIAAKEEGHIVKAGRNLSEWPDHMDLENCKRLSMMYNFIQNFPTIPIEAPNLRALLLNNNSSLTKPPSNTFADMKSLMTLDLSDTYIEFLPPSLSYLQNLRTLLINNTPLQSPLPIDKLERLEVLSLRRVVDRESYFRFIQELPEVIGNLINLRHLDLTGNISNKRNRRNGFSNLRDQFELILNPIGASSSNSDSIRPDPFLKLVRLEELLVFNSLISQMSGSSQTNNFLVEIGSLSRLSFLELAVYNPDMCHLDFPGPWQDLTRFTIHIGNEIVNLAGSTGFSRTLKILDIRRKEVGNWVLALLGRTNYLEVEGWEGFQSLAELGAAVANGMNENLKSLQLCRCSKMECLVSSNKGLFQSNRNAFLSNLEDLLISDMNAFVEICRGTPPLTLLYKLKKLTLRGCEGLVTAIPGKLIQNLQKLESLFLWSCKNLLHLVEMEEVEESVGSSNSDFRRISEPIFPNLKYIEIRYTPEIRYVFTMRVARNLLLLEKLWIFDCLEMEVVLKYEDGEDIQFNEDTAILPRLKELIVKKAPKLKSFTNCNLVMEFPSLESLDLRKCGMLERLPFGTTSLPNLKIFQIKHIPKMRHVFTMRAARNLLQLEELHVRKGCLEIELLFEYEDGDNIQFNEDTAILPRLRKMTVNKAPKLKSFTNQNLVMDLPSLEELKVKKCGILERLPFGTTSVPNLKKFIGKTVLIDRLRWEDESVKARLQAILEDTP